MAKAKEKMLNLHGRLLSILLPYVWFLFAFLVFHLARIPWLISNEHQEEFESVTVKLRASEQNNALLQEHLSKRNWPEERPRITLDRWGQQVGPHGVLRPESGFYLTNHGDTALEVVLEDFNLGSDKWVGDRLSSIEGQQKGFMKVERTTFVYGDAQRWNLMDGFRVARKSEQRVRIRYRDFNNNWYRSTAMLTCAPNFGSIEVGATTQEPLGSSESVCLVALLRLTDGGLGVAFFSPFDNKRYFLPWRPIRVSPISVTHISLNCRLATAQDG